MSASEGHLQKFLRLPEVLLLTGLSRATVYRRIRADEFPRGIKDGRCTLWATSQIAAWQKDKLRQSPFPRHETRHLNSES
ncbi:helix-turn-helix transcriptional regulator [Brevundimonas lenta]|uniref:helix-turn-helix transcriptional regulator n=1 Tax=Brevundimonas lenta TaxID=424796 RepID=UPI003CD06EED